MRAGGTRPDWQPEGKKPRRDRYAQRTRAPTCCSCSSEYHPFALFPVFAENTLVSSAGTCNPKVRFPSTLLSSLTWHYILPNIRRRAASGATGLRLRGAPLVSRSPAHAWMERGLCRTALSDRSNRCGYKNHQELTICLSIPVFC